MEQKEKLKGLGGWLILPAIGLIINSLALSYFSLESFMIILLEDFSFILFFVLDVAGACFFIYTTVLFFKEKRNLPKWMIFVLWYQFIYVIILSISTEGYSNVLGSLAAAWIWTSYFRESKRVKNTFIK